MESRDAVEIPPAASQATSQGDVPSGRVPNVGSNHRLCAHRPLSAVEPGMSAFCVPALPMPILGPGFYYQAKIRFIG